MKVFLSGSNPNSEVKVAGIASVMKVLLSNPKIDYKIFGVGRNNEEKRNLKWFLKSVWKLIFPLGRLDFDFKIAHINTCMNPMAIIRDYAIVKAMKKRNIPILLHIHGGEYLLNKPKNKIFHYYIKRILKLSDVVILLTDIEKLNFPYNVEESKLEVLLNCINPSEIPKNLPEIEKGHIVFLGRIDEKKGVYDLMNALSILIKERKDFHFHLCGTGPLQGEFVNKLKEELPDNHTYHGVVTGNSKWEILAKSEIFVLPSWFEGLPMSLLEAMITNTAIIVSKDPSMEYYIKENENGLLVSKKNPCELADKIKRILSDSSFSDRISSNAKKTYHANFSIDDYYNKIEGIYYKLIQ